MAIHKDLGRLVAALAASAILGNCGLLNRHKGAIEGYKVEVHHLKEPYLRVVLNSINKDYPIQHIEVDVVDPRYLSSKSPPFLIGGKLKKSDKTECSVPLTSSSVPECSDSDYETIEKLSRQAVGLFHTAR